MPGIEITAVEDGLDVHMLGYGFDHTSSKLLKFLEAQRAERLMRAWWPLLWLIPTMAGMTAIAWRIAGREAAIIAIGVLCAENATEGFARGERGLLFRHATP